MGYVQKLRALGKAKLKSFSLKKNYLTDNEKAIAVRIKKLMKELEEHWDKNTAEALEVYGDRSPDKEIDDGDSTEEVYNDGE